MELFGLIIFSLHLLECHGKKVENIAIVDVKKKESFVVSKRNCKTLGGRLARRTTLNEHLPCLNITLDTSKKYWIGKDKDCNPTGNKYCTFKLTKNKMPEFKTKKGRKWYFALCEVDRSTYQNKSLCPFEKSTKRPIATPSMSIGDELTTAYQTDSIPHASNGTITTMSMELSYDGKRMENIAIVDIKEKYSFNESVAQCKNLGGSLVRRATLQKYRSCIKESLDPLKQYWIGKDLSRYKDKRRVCPSEKTTKGHRATPSMSDGGVLTTAYQTESITDASNTGRTTTIVISGEQSYDDGSSVEVIIPVVCFLLVAFVVVLTVFVKKRRKRKAIKSKNVPHDPNTLKPTEMAPVHESNSEHNNMLDENPYAEIKESMTGINQASVPNTIKPDETDSNSLKPNEMVPVPVSDSTLYHILEESPYSEITGSGAENCQNHQASECQESPTRDNEDETYDHLERNRSESRHGSEVDVAHPETDNASEALLEDSCGVKAEKDSAHLELTEQSSNVKMFSEYSITDDASRINKDKTYDHLERNRNESRHGSEVDVAHPEIENASEALLKDSCEVKTDKDYDHLELTEQSSNIKVFSEYSMTDDATRINKDETYARLERNRSESRHGSEVDVAHQEIDNASEALLEDSCEVKTEKYYDHLELKEQSSNIEVFSEYSTTAEDADYSDLSKRKPLENPCSDYDHANLK